MVAQNSTDFSIFRGHARQRGRDFGALAQTLGRTAIPFIKRSGVPAAKRLEQFCLKPLVRRFGKLLVDAKTRNNC